MGWRGFGRGYGMWPGRGPFSYLPPWQRPGWLFGRGACWWLFPSIYMNPYYLGTFPWTTYYPPAPYPYYYRRW
ncbi:MAG: hypothetical protein ACPLZF_06255 [Nitrososphaeria archaeon]